MKRSFRACLMAAALFTACTQATTNNEEEIRYEGNKVTVNEDSPVLSKLVCEEVTLSPFSSEMRTVGSVQAEPDCYAEVGVPFDGRITRSLTRLGAKVRAGQVLFELSSPDFLEASKSYFQSVQSYEKAKVEYDRRKTLHEYGVSSQKELDEAFTEAEIARKDMESAAGMISVFGTDPEKLKMGQPMTITAPINGEVVYSNLTTGSFIKADSDPVITIANLSKVWVTALVKERFAGNVTKGEKVEIFTESDPDTAIYGDIINVGNLVDQETRSIQVVISCDNADAKLKHGMYVSVHFMSEPKDAVVLPSTAVFQGEERCYVYVCTGEENVFEKRLIETGTSNDDNTRISVRNGLNVGERVVVSGGLYLNN